MPLHFLLYSATMILSLIFWAHLRHMHQKSLLQEWQYLMFSGQKYAYLEMKAALYGILRNFIIQPIDSAETIVLIPDIVLRTKEERLLLKFLPRR